MSDNQDRITLDLTDIDGLVSAVQIANKRGAFSLDEAGQIAGAVSRIKSWVTVARSGLSSQSNNQEKESNENSSSTDKE